MGTGHRPRLGFPEPAEPLAHLPRAPLLSSEPRRQRSPRSSGLYHVSPGPLKMTHIPPRTRKGTEKWFGKGKPWPEG